MSKQKKDTKLIFEILTAVVPIFVLAGALFMYILYNSILDSFLEAKREMMAAQIDQVLVYTEYLENEFIVSQWKENREQMIIDPSEEEESRYYDFIEANPGFEWKPENLRKVDDPFIINFISGTAFSTTFYDFQWGAQSFDLQMLFIISVDDSGEVFVIYDDAPIDDESFGLGDTLKYDMSKHPSLKKALSSGSPDCVFEHTSEYLHKGDYYVCYKPIVKDGKVICFVGTACMWSEIYMKYIDMFSSSAIISTLGVVATFAVLLFILFTRVLKPVDKIQKNLRSYIGDKESSKIIAQMDSITSRNEIGRLSEDISDLAREIDKYTADIIAITGEHQRVATELDMAKNIQAGQLPSQFPAFPERNSFDIYATMTPAKEVGGDFYDFFLIDDDHLALVMADVSGKGVPAALFMMMSKMLIHNYAMIGLTPHEVLERTNESIFQNNPEKMFVTVWFGILEISTGKITASNAGHEFPIIKQPDGEYELFKDKHGFVLGGIEGKKYKDYEVTLGKGGMIFLYTDGVPEATNSNTELYGTDRLIEAMNRYPNADPKELLSVVHRSVNEFVGEADQFDDLTMMALKIL